MKCVGVQHLKVDRNATFKGVLETGKEVQHLKVGGGAM